MSNFHNRKKSPLFSVQNQYRTLEEQKPVSIIESDDNKENSNINITVKQKYSHGLRESLPE